MATEEAGATPVAVVATIVVATVEDPRATAEVVVDLPTRRPGTLLIAAEEEEEEVATAVVTAAAVA